MSTSTQKLFHSLNDRSLEQLSQIINIDSVKPVEEDTTVINDPLDINYLKSLIWIVKHRKQGFYLVPLCELIKNKRKIICPVKDDPSSQLKNINQQVKIVEIVRDSLPEESSKGVIFVKTELNF